MVPQQPALGCTEGLRCLALLFNLCLHLSRCDAAELGLPWGWEVRVCAGVDVENLSGSLPSCVKHLPARTQHTHPSTWHLPSKPPFLFSCIFPTAFELPKMFLFLFFVFSVLSCW